MKGIFGPYVLWPLDKKLIFWIVTRVSARDYTVHQKKEIQIFIPYIIAKKHAKLRSHIASLKMHLTQVHPKFQQNKFTPEHRNLLPHIATGNLRLHIASHALQLS